MTSEATRKKKMKKMMKRKGITSLDLLFRKSAQEITCQSGVVAIFYQKSQQSDLFLLTVVEGTEDDQDADHHKYEGWKTPPIILR